MPAPVVIGLAAELVQFFLQIQKENELRKTNDKNLNTALAADGDVRLKLTKALFASQIAQNDPSFQNTAQADRLEADKAIAALEAVPTLEAGRQAKRNAAAQEAIAIANGDVARAESALAASPSDPEKRALASLARCKLEAAQYIGARVSGVAANDPFVTGPSNPNGLPPASRESSTNVPSAPTGTGLSEKKDGKSSAELRRERYEMQRAETERKKRLAEEKLQKMRDQLKSFRVTGDTVAGTLVVLGEMIGEHVALTVLGARKKAPKRSSGPACVFSKPVSATVTFDDGATSSITDADKIVGEDGCLWHHEDGEHLVCDYPKSVAVHRGGSVQKLSAVRSLVVKGGDVRCDQ